MDAGVYGTRGKGSQVYHHEAVGAHAPGRLGFAESRNDGLMSTVARDGVGPCFFFKSSHKGSDLSERKSGLGARCLNGVTSPCPHASWLVALGSQPYDGRRRHLRSQGDGQVRPCPSSSWRASTNRARQSEWYLFCRPLAVSSMAMGPCLSVHLDAGRTGGGGGSIWS